MKCVPSSAPNNYPSAVRIVLDTNVVLSGVLWTGVPKRLIEAILEERVEAFTSVPLLEELLNVAGRAHLAKKMAELRLTPALLLERYRDITEIVLPGPIERVVASDPADDLLIATAIAAHAEIIVSGDRAVLAIANYAGIDILSPAQAITRITTPP